MKLDDYIEAIAIREVLGRPETYVTSEESDIAIRRVIEFLTEEEGLNRLVPPDRNDAKRLLRALLNVRPPGRLSGDILRELDRLLWTERVEAGIVLSNDIVPISESFGYPGRHGNVLCLWQGDITQLEADAIVNAANAYLQHGGGVAGVISRSGGPEIQAESNAWVAEHGPAGNAEPAYTTAGELPCRCVIHAVGPIWGSDDEDAKLDAAVTGSLQLAEKLDLRSLALPAISTGIYGFPKERAAHVIFVHFRTEKNVGVSRENQLQMQF